MVLKPKSKKGSHKASENSSQWPLGIPPLSSTKKYITTKYLWIRVGSIFTGFCILLYVFSKFFNPRDNTSSNNYPAVHGLYMNELAASSRLIFPHVEHATILKEIGIRGLYVFRADIDGTKQYVLKADDKPLTDEEKKKSTDQVYLVKKSFLDHGKLVYRKKSDEPEIVIVTLVDFERYDLENIVKVVQNRVDYAQIHRYGVYVRWIQEFLPVMSNQDMDTNYDFYKALVMRAALHAFPRTKSFLFIDQDSLIMNLNLSLKKHLLDKNILDLALLRNVPIKPGSNVRTYDHIDFNAVSMVIPQDENGILDLSSFVVSNDYYSKAFLEFLIDPIVRDYGWQESFPSVVAHVLQWHPQLLSKTAIVVPKVMASEFDDTRSEDEVDAFHYTEGDLVASFKGCRVAGTCAKYINNMYARTKKT
ncbi:similar to Saccharomyces cerevisiae YJL183W MNN11 Subunit of a Golgi mannosyltransferase complex that also contains Anp1p [Maudiozyma barnettii]|uniref:Similar to Saccharomyces cerevisiae YJL183W MNN11 Subunit of a Golgi mannosyltransferase complex that also contains Anp1p n=1 Tax=Maudiozyma barnettii TaxID=61262 RepID=A0A8H2VFW9_9SACH|nr:alpha-1,6-mannosyltransferase [Kazachstania barnettii]CAB4254706.1 similar to Saccharomyces cerevisiae YJL183W MNN11 Subunit of a Golgi mannosyltransferase complex that also contains Anp1p [Kazachstania barnettii]CAD1782748.1 similar to Saccharomyces cerevisiae YJL183W MNN11 Subunit of a Golgi mannosyltransferase complex that also contains Anp1p [Kazachstania barnettii]